MFEDITRACALNTGYLREDHWHSQVRQHAAKWCLSADDERHLNILLSGRHIRGRQPLSNRWVRTAAREALVDTFLDHQAACPARPLYLITFAWGAGFTWLNEPVVDLVVMQRAVDAFLRREVLTGVCAFEFDGVLPLPGGGDYPVLFHVHGIVTPEDGRRLKQLREINADYAQRSAFSNPWGAPGVDIKRIKDSPADLARVAVYMVDPIHQLKRREPDRFRPGRTKLVGTRSGYSPAIIMRLTEIQSHLTPNDIVFGVGSLGKRLRAEWRRRVAGCFAPGGGRAAVLDTKYDTGDFWLRARADNGSPRYQPCRITTRASVYRARSTS